MKRNFSKMLLTAILSSSLMVGCASTTNTGSIGVNRQQFMLISSEQIIQMSAKSYEDTLAKARRSRVLDVSPTVRRRLEGIMHRLVPHVAAYRSDAVNWDWEVHVIQSDMVNAYAMPGGKIMFYSGIVNKLHLSDAEIAAIMGHEMSHAIREHSRERMSSQYATQAGIGIAAGIFGLSAGQAQLASMAGNLGVGLPHSRVQEREADAIGLELMARAGYNPQSAINLWRKMQQESASSGGGNPPQFLSTHPSSSNRIADLQALMPKVMPLYRRTQQ